MDSTQQPCKGKPCIIEFVGSSGVGKSFLFQKLKGKLVGNPEYLFVEKGLYKRTQMVYPWLFINTVVKLLLCNINTRQRLYKHIKMWYFTQVLIRKGLKSTARYVFIEEGPLHRIRAIKSHSQKDPQTVIKLLLTRKTVKTDIVMFIDASPENLYNWRQKRGSRATHVTIEQTCKNNGNSLARTSNDIKYVHDNLKNIIFQKITNKENNLSATLDELLRKVQELSV